MSRLLHTFILGGLGGYPSNSWLSTPKQAPAAPDIKKIPVQSFTDDALLSLFIFKLQENFPGATENLAMHEITYLYDDDDYDIEYILFRASCPDIQSWQEILDRAGIPYYTVSFTGDQQDINPSWLGLKISDLKDYIQASTCLIV